MWDENMSLTVLCSYCKKAVVNKKVKCIECQSSFHPSCSIKKTKSCCDKPNIVEENLKNVESNLQTQEEILEDSSCEKSVQWENKILKEMNAELRENNNLLKEKIENLEIEIASIRNILYQKESEKPKEDNIFEVIQMLQHSFEIKINSVVESINALKPYVTDNNPEIELSMIKNINMVDKETPDLKQKEPPQEKTDKNSVTTNQYSNIVKKKTGKEVQGSDTSMKQNSKSDYRKKQGNITNDIIIEEEISDNTHDERWKEVKRKKKNRITQQKGEGEDSTGNFKGEQPRVWMFLYRVKQDVTEEHIKCYLKTKTGRKEDDFIVKNLKTTEGSRYKQFMVAADFTLKNDFYNPEFWPRGVGYKRFNFKQYYEKFQIRNVISGEVESNTSESFLGFPKQSTTAEV